MKNLLCFQSLLCCFILIANSNASAQSVDSIKVGESDVIPSVRLEYVTNSNAFLTNREEVSASGIRISPSVEVRANRRLLDVRFGYNGDFSSMSEDAINFDDHRLYGELYAELDTRKRLKGLITLSKEHEELGRGRTFGTVSRASEAVEYLDLTLDGNYTYGAESAKGNLIGGVFFSNRNYQNRPDLTLGADVLEIAPYGQFTYRVSSATRALIELRLRSLNFESDLLDRTEIQALVGLEFIGNGKADGSLKIGVGDANYDDEAVSDTSFLVVNTNLNYSATEFSEFSLDYSRQLDDSDVAALSQSQAQTIEDALKFSWNHRWSVFFGSSVYFSANISGRDCPTPSSQTSTTGLEVDLSPRRWVQFGFGFANEIRDIDGCPSGEDFSAQEYERQYVSVFLKLSV